MLHRFPSPGAPAEARRLISLGGGKFGGKFRRNFVGVFGATKELLKNIRDNFGAFCVRKFVPRKKSLVPTSFCRHATLSFLFFHGFFSATSRLVLSIHSLHLAITGESFTHSLYSREYIHTIHSNNGHYGVAKKASISWVAKLRGDKSAKWKPSNGWSRSYREIKLLLSTIK